MRLVKIFMFYETTKEIWDAAKETYSNSDNTSEIFEIKSVLHDLRQGDLTMTQYFNTLNRHWQQLDVFEELEWKCTEDSIKYKKVVENERIFKCLLGLNKNLDKVRGRVLSTKPLPSIREAFSEVQREKSRKILMLGNFTKQPPPKVQLWSLEGLTSQAMTTSEKVGLGVTTVKDLDTLKRHFARYTANLQTGNHPDTNMTAKVGDTWLPEKRLNDRICRLQQRTNGVITKAD
ncbi:hypothetical protein ACOSP7_031220 [Xanthoceras sorbifolium]